MQTQFKKYCNYLSLMVLVGCLGACSAYPDLSQLSQESNETEIQSDSHSQIRTQFVGEATAHLYSVELKWEIEGVGEVMLYRIAKERIGQEESALRETFLGTLPRNGRFVDSQRPAGSFLTYELRDSLGIKQASKALILPKDLLVRKEMILPPNYHEYGRILFEEDSTLVTQGASISWKLFEVRGARGASIVSFKESDEAAAFQVGRDSGRLHLEVEFLEGDLNIEWRGQRGAQGLEGEENLERGRVGSNGSDGFTGWSGGEARCRKQAGNGGQGGRGPRGVKGGSGFSGGNVENVFVVIRRQSETARMFVNTQVGRGGRGGLGGLGGRGGQGGRGGNGGMECGDGHKGPEGQRGPRGAAGDVGRDGTFLGSVCARVGDQIVQGPCSR